MFAPSSIPFGEIREALLIAGSDPRVNLPTMLDPVRPIALDDIRAAQKRIAGTVMRTPLVRLELGAGYPDIRLKLENLQPINAYKLRGAANAVAMLPRRRTQARRVDDQRRQRGAGRRLCGAQGGRAVHGGGDRNGAGSEDGAHAGARRAAGASRRSIECWQAMDDRAYPGVEGTFVHPFDDHNFIAGNATMGLEILEDAPDVAAVIGGVGGGGLVTGVGSAIKALKPGREGLRRRAGDRCAGCAVVRRRTRRRCSRAGRRRSSTAPAARACSRACGSG